MHNKNIKNIKQNERCIRIVKRLLEMGAVREQLPINFQECAKKYGLLDKFPKTGKVIDFVDISKKTGVDYSIVCGILTRVNPYRVRRRKIYYDAVQKIKKYFREEGIEEIIPFLENVERALRREYI